MQVHDGGGVEMNRNPRVLALIGEMDGCSLWRCLLPITELQCQGYQGFEWGIKDDDRLAAIVHRFDAVILPRLHWPPEEQPKADMWFRALHRAGITILYELDDDLFSEDFERRLVDHRGYTAEGARERRGCILMTIRQCDGMTVSGQRLATMARAHVDIPIRVVPNYIDLRWFKRVQKQAERKVHGLTIGWAGGARPELDIETMAIAWGRIARKYPHVTFVIQGHHAKAFYEHVPNERIAMLDWLPIDYYPVGLVNIDIGCCPLADTKFNRAKTFIKAMEYAASGAAVVASPTIYSGLIEHGVDGYIANSVDEWEEYLSRLVEDYRLRHKIARALLAKVRREHALETNAWRWVDAWASLLDEHNYRKSHRILLPEGVVYANPHA